MSQLSDTTRLIMEIYGEPNAKKNQGFKVMDLMLNSSLLNSRHQTKVSMAINELIELGYLEWGQEAELLLTEKGSKTLTINEYIISSQETKYNECFEPSF